MGATRKSEAATSRVEGRDDETAAALRRENALLRRKVDELRASGQAAREEQRTLFALVAHNLKGPILPLELSLRALERSIETGRPPPRDVFARAKRQVRRIARAIDSLLVEMPCVEDGTITATFARFDVREPVRTAVAELRSLLDTRTFVLIEPAEAVLVHCDSARVQHIVGMLLDNAVKYSPPGAPIEIEITHGTQATVEVRDSGIGIPQSEQAHLFDKFFRGSNAPPSIYRGIGVGLYLARAYAELCHGRLVIESAEGIGTTARLVLPLAHE